MPPHLQAAFAAAEAAAIGASAKLPLTQRGQLEEACRAALQVADRCGMTAEEKTAVGAASCSSSCNVGHPEERSEIASSFALATAANLGMSAEAQQQAAGGVSAAGRIEHIQDVYVFIEKHKPAITILLVERWMRIMRLLS